MLHEFAVDLQFHANVQTGSEAFDLQPRLFVEILKLRSVQLSTTRLNGYS